MALTKTWLRGMGLSEDQVSSIMEEAGEVHSKHMETVNRMQKEIDDYKKDSRNLQELQKELDDIKKEDWKSKFEKEHAEFESFKSEQTKSKTEADKKKALNSLIEEVGLSDLGKEKAVKFTKLDKFELDADGKIKNAEELKKELATEWSAFVVEKGKEGSKAPNPPGGTGTMTKDEILNIKDPVKRQKAIAENITLFED